MQLSAIRSWKRALPEARVILYGNEPGLVDVCRKEKVDFGGSVKVGHDGVEIVTDIFRQAAFLAGRAGMIYLNSDILLDESARKAYTLLENLPGGYLGTGRRRCLPAWVGSALKGAELDAYLIACRKPVRWGQASSLDIFFLRDFSVETMPCFRIGQAAWDNWMIFRAREMGLSVVDLSSVLRPFHCDHDYRYTKNNSEPISRNRLRDQQNLDLLGGVAKRFHMGHCNYEVLDGAIVRRRGPAFWQREIDVMRLKTPAHECWIRPLRALFRPWIRTWEKYTTRKENWNLCPPSSKELA